jgi:predicted CopG family antitoxin
MVADPPTTITVRTSTLRALSLYKSGGESYDDVLKGLMEEIPPESFIRWTKEELKRPSQSLAQVRKRIGLRSA